MRSIRNWAKSILVVVMMAVFLGVTGIVLPVFEDKVEAKKVVKGGKVKKESLLIKNLPNKFTTANGMAKITFKSQIKQKIEIQIVDSKGKMTALIKTTIVPANALTSVYWNGRMREAGKRYFGDYARAGIYKVKFICPKSVVISKPFRVYAGKTQFIKKVFVSPTGFVGEKTIKIMFEISRKHDVLIKLLDKSGKTAFSKKIRDVLPSKEVGIAISGRANAGNQLGLKSGEPLNFGDYTVTISSCNKVYKKNIKLYEHLQQLNQFSINQINGGYTSSWLSLRNALKYELRIKNMQTNKIDSISVDKIDEVDVFEFNVTMYLKDVGKYILVMYATGDKFHPKSKVGTFSYSIFGKITSPQNLRIISNNGIITANWDNVQYADSFEVSVFFNEELVDTFTAVDILKQDISKSVRENGFGDYTYTVFATNSKNKCYVDSDIVRSEKYAFNGFPSPIDVAVTKGTNGVYKADWADVEGVEYYILNLYVKGTRVITIFCGSSEANLTSYVPKKGEKYQVSVYSFGNDAHDDSLWSEMFEFTA